MDKEDAKTLLEELSRIQAETLLLNEDAQNADKKDEGADIDNDLDKLLQQQEGGEQSDDAADKPAEEKSSDIGDIPDLNGEDGEKPANGAGEDAVPADAEPKEDQKNFETDTAGLVDAITKLTKDGKTVKIVVSAEGRQMGLINGKTLVSLKQLCEMANPTTKKGARRPSMNTAEALLREQLEKMTRRIAALEQGKPLVEDKIIKIREKDYEALLEAVKDLNFKIDEQASQLKAYEALGISANSENVEEVSAMLDELNSEIDSMNKQNVSAVVSNTSFNSFNVGADSALGIMHESIMPVLNSLNETKVKALSALDEALAPKVTIRYVETAKKNAGSSFLIDEATESLEKLNMIDRYRTLVESKISSGGTYSASSIMSILDEASSDIIVTDGDSSIDGADNNFPQYEYFSKRVTRLLQDAFTKAKSYNSDISVKNDEDGSEFAQKSQTQKNELPIMNPEKWNAPTTIKSAIMNLNENLRDVDGNLDLALCERAFLYKRVSKPESTDDFAFPIGIVEQSDHKLYACPALIESVAKLLSKDTCVRTYNLKSKDELIALRESLTPYLKEIGMEIPWEKKAEPKK